MRAVPTVAVVGTGPAGIAATRQLRDQAGVRVVLVAPEGRSEYLPGTLAVAAGDARAAQYRTRVELAGVEIIPARVEAIEPGALRIGGSWIRAHAVIAAPGLALDPVGGATSGEIVGFWDPTGAEAAAPRMRAVERGLVDVVISSLPYRCPPAPYGLAMRLARRARRLGQQLQVRLVTPEEHPLAALGRVLGDALLAGCQDAGVEVSLGAKIDPEALARGAITARASDGDGADLTIVIPRHRTSPLLADLVDATSPLVTVDARFGTEMTGVFVVGDAAASPYPRAADPPRGRERSQRRQCCPSSASSTPGTPRRLHRTASSTTATAPTGVSGSPTRMGHHPGGSPLSPSLPPHRHWQRTSKMPTGDGTHCASKASDQHMRSVSPLAHPASPRPWCCRRRPRCERLRGVGAAACLGVTDDREGRRLCRPGCCAKALPMNFHLTLDAG